MLSRLSNMSIHTIWIITIVLTSASYLFGKLGFSGFSIVFIMLLTSGIKGYLIIRDFMELRDVSLLWRVMMYGWLWFVCVAIGIIYLVS